MSAADWRTMRFRGSAVVSRVAAVFEIGPPLPDPLPFASLTVTVLERNDGCFAAFPNVAVRSADGFPDWIAGLGDTPDEALADLLDHFWRTVEQAGATQAGDFVWAGVSHSGEGGA